MTPPRYPETCAFAELLIYCEEDRTLRGVPIGMLREAGGRHWVRRSHTV